MFYLHEKRIAEGKERNFVCVVFFFNKRRLKRIMREISPGANHSPSLPQMLCVLELLALMPESSICGR